MRQAKPIKVQLPPSLRRLVDARVKAGEFASADELISHSLRLFASEQRRMEAERDSIKEKIAEGIQQAQRGELLDGEAVVREIRARLRRSKARKAG